MLLAAGPSNDRYGKADIEARQVSEGGAVEVRLRPGSDEWVLPSYLAGALIDGGVSYAAFLANPASGLLLGASLALVDGLFFVSLRNTQPPALEIVPPDADASRHAPAIVRSGFVAESDGSYVARAPAAMIRQEPDGCYMSLAVTRAGSVRARRVVAVTGPDGGPVCHVEPPPGPAARAPGAKGNRSLATVASGKGGAAAPPPRVVLLEVFMRSTCGNCQDSARYLDDLSVRYSGSLAVIEASADAGDGWRQSLWWQAWASDETAMLPMVMLDSGTQVMSGHHSDFAGVFKKIVDAELARPALAAIEAAAKRDGDRVRLSVNLTNLSDTVLGPANHASLHAIVYEEARIGLTGRHSRVALRDPLSRPLAPGATLSRSLASEPLAGVDWSHLRAAVFADFQPYGPEFRHEALQTALVDVR